MTELNLASMKLGLSDMFDCNGTLLQAGQVCLMKHRGRPESLVGYHVGVEPIVMGPNDRAGLATLQTFIPGRHKSWLHHDWAGRLEVVGTMESHGHLLNDQSILNQEIQP